MSIAKGQRVKSSDTKPTILSQQSVRVEIPMTYKSGTLNIKLERKSVHGISYWASAYKNMPVPNS